MNGERQRSFFIRVNESFLDSSGVIVFGVTDGTASVFGLVVRMVLTPVCQCCIQPAAHPLTGYENPSFFWQ